MMFQLHGGHDLIHSEYSALKYIDLSLMKYLNIVNEIGYYLTFLCLCICKMLN